MSFIEAPLWIQVALGAEALALAWLTARFGWRGLVWSLLGSAAFWFVLGLAASFLVGRLEGGRASDLGSMIPGAGLATVRLAQAAWPMLVAAAVLGSGLRIFLARSKGTVGEGKGGPPSHH